MLRGSCEKYRASTPIRRDWHHDSLDFLRFALAKVDSLGSSRSLLGAVRAQRAAKLHFSKTKAVAQLVRGARQFFEPFAPLRFEQIELLAAVREAAEAHAKQADFAFHVAVLSKKFLKHAKNIGIELRRLGKSFRARVRVESGVANRQRERARRQSRFAQDVCTLFARDG